MGAFIPTPADQEICANLGKRFSDTIDPNSPTGNSTYIQVLRDHQTAGERFFDGHHHLHRIAYRLGGVCQNNQSRWRWYHLLRNLLPKATTDAINSVLGQVLADTTIVCAQFDVAYDPNIASAFELYPGNSSQPVIVYVAGKKTCMVQLVCKADQQLPDSPNEPDPPAADSNEQPPVMLP
jgi:hypothetical protein